MRRLLALAALCLACGRTDPLAPRTDGCGECPAAPRAQMGCDGGQCVIAGCEGAYADCDGERANGCEVNLRNDLRHCGRCNRVCMLRCSDGSCGFDPGCADGSREGFVVRQQFPDIAACAGRFDDVDGDAAQKLCAPGWHVCRGSDPPVRAVSLGDARLFGGCFAFDAAHDCFDCFPTCRSALGSCQKCCVGTREADPDLAGVGAGCRQYPVRDAGASCLANGRIDATTNDFGCRWREGITGVVCCRD